MLDWVNSAILALADPLLDWLLRLPTDLALVIVAVGTGAIIALSRLFTTNQDLLRRCNQDKKRLKELIRQAKRQKDKEAVKRYRTTRNMIGMMTMKEEGWPLLAAVVPIAILGTWCFQRLAFVPPRAGETVSVRAYFPVSAVGELAHLVPQEGLREVSREESGSSGHWIQEITKDVPWRWRNCQPRNRNLEDPGQGKARAVCAGDPLQDGHRGEGVARRAAGLFARREILRQRPSHPQAQIEMKPVKFLGLVPGIDWLLMPPWLVAYFLIAIPSVSLVKRVTGVC